MKILTHEDRLLIDDLIAAARLVKGKSMSDLERLLYDIRQFDVYAIHDAKTDPVEYSKRLNYLRQQIDLRIQSDTVLYRVALAGLSPSRDRELFDKYFETQHRLGRYIELREKVLSNPVTKLIYDGWDEDSVEAFLRLASLAKPIQAYAGSGCRMVKGPYLGLPIGEALQVIQTHGLPYGMATPATLGDTIDRFVEYAQTHVATLVARGRVRTPGVDTITVEFPETTLTLHQYTHPRGNLPVYHLQVSGKHGSFGVLI